MTFTEPVYLRVDKTMKDKLKLKLRGRPEAVIIRKLIQMYIDGNIVMKWDDGQEVDYRNVM